MHRVDAVRSLNTREPVEVKSRILREKMNYKSRCRRTQCLDMFIKTARESDALEDGRYYGLEMDALGMDALGTLSWFGHGCEHECDASKWMRYLIVVVEEVVGIIPIMKRRERFKSSLLSPARSQYSLR